MCGFQLCAFADEAGSAIEAQIAALKENGISLLEVRGVGEKNIADLTVEEAKELRRRLSDAGIRVWSIGSPIGKTKITEDFAPHLDRMKHVLELADVLGASCIRIFSFYLDGRSPADSQNEVLYRMGAFCEVAAGSNITLCHENEKGIYGDTPERCFELHTNLPSLKCVFDPANFLQCGVDPQEAWVKLEPHIHYLHIKDVNQQGVLVPAGQGEGHLPALIAKFGQMGGRVLTLEPHLATFQGLEALENGEKSAIDPFTYATGREAFDAAANALKDILVQKGV